MIKYIKFPLMLLLALCATVPLVAAPTSCCMIPTADVLETGSVYLELENDGYPAVGDSDSTTYGLVQVGIVPRVEIGLDRIHESGDTDDLFNVKYLALDESKSRPALAVGLMDLSKGQRASWYGIGTKSFRALRVHAGYIHADYADGAMLGCDYSLGSDTCLIADWMNGTGNYLTLGINRQLKKGFAVTLMYGFPNDHSASKLAVANLSYTFSFSRSKVDE